MKPTSQWDWRPRPCVDCGQEFIPSGSAHKVCPDCHDEHYNKMKRKWRKTEKARQFYRKKWEQQKFHSNMLNNTDFLKRVEKKILGRRGTMLSTKAVSRRVFKDMDILSSIMENGAELTACYDAVELMMREHGGENVGRSQHSGIYFRFARE